MTDTVIAEIIGGSVTLVTTLITTLFAYLTNRPAPPESKIILTGNAPAAKKRRQWGFRIDYLWIPIVFVGGVAVTLICMLAVQHEARQNVRKILADSPEFHINMGDQYAAMGDFASAELEYYQAIEDDDSDAFAHDKRAVALAKDGRLEEALEENLKACAYAPDVAQYHNNKGVTLFELGDRKGKEGNKKARKQYYKNAAEAYKTAVGLDSTVADYHYNLSKALYVTSDIDDAISECTTALQLNPEKSEYHYWYSAYLCAKGQYENALNEARKAVELAPDDAAAYFTLAWCLQGMNQFDEAVSAYRQAIQLNPDEGAYYSYLGQVLYELGRYREALEEQKTSINLTPYPYQQSIAYYNVATDLFMLNRYEEALQYVEKSVELYPDDPEHRYLHYALLTYFNRHEEAEQERQAAYDLGLSEEEYT